MKFVDYEIPLRSEAMGILGYAREFGLSADEVRDVWHLGIAAAMAERHADSAKHLWLVKAQAFALEHGPAVVPCVVSAES